MKYEDLEFKCLICEEKMSVVAEEVMMFDYFNERYTDNRALDKNFLRIFIFPKTFVIPDELEKNVTDFIDY